MAAFANSESLPFVTRRMHCRSWMTTLAMATLAAAELIACPYSLRDAAFLGGEAHSPYQLFVVAGADEAKPSDVAKWMHSAASEQLGGTPVELRSIDIENPPIDELSARTLSALRGESGVTAPRALLVALDGRSLVLTPRTTALSASSIDAAARFAVASPARAALRRALPKTWCVGILVDSADSAANTRAQATFEAAANALRGHETELGKKIEDTPILVTIPRAAIKTERVLLWSLGLDAVAEAPRIALLVGRGEQRADVLAGDAITAAALRERFEMLGRSCTCTTSAMWLSGPVVPMAWRESEKSAAKTALGFDPDDPLVRNAILDATGQSKRSSNPADGYAELSLDGDLEVDAPVAGDSQVEAILARTDAAAAPPDDLSPSSEGRQVRSYSKGEDDREPAVNPGGFGDWRVGIGLVIGIGASFLASATAMVYMWRLRAKERA